MALSDLTDEEVALLRAATRAQDQILRRMQNALYPAAETIDKLYTAYQADIGAGGKYADASALLNRRFAGGAGGKIVAAINKARGAAADMEAAIAINPTLFPRLATDVEPEAAPEPEGNDKVNART